MDTVREGIPTIITVEHSIANGWHEFTCPQVPGFYLIAEASDLEAAFSQIPEAIAEIVEADEGFPVKVVQRQTYSEYLAKLPEGFRPSLTHYEIKRRQVA